jgi:uncharacterized tellurite resistance protein B-like protein
MDKHLFNRLYFLLITADGEVNDKEIKMWVKVAALYGFDHDFNEQLDLLKVGGKKQLLASCIRDLKNTTIEEQVNLMALLCVLANADGFMHKTEWELIYSIYHKELKLNQLEILETERHLKKTLLSA